MQMMKTITGMNHILDMVELKKVKQNLQQQNLQHIHIIMYEHLNKVMLKNGMILRVQNDYIGIIVLVHLKKYKQMVRELLKS